MNESYSPYVALADHTGGDIPAKEALLKAVKSGVSTNPFRIGQYPGLHTLEEVLREGKTRIDGAVIFIDNSDIHDTDLMEYLQKYVLLGIRRIMVVYDCPAVALDYDLECFITEEIEGYLESLHFPTDQFQCISCPVTSFVKEGEQHLEYVRQLIAEINNMIVIPAAKSEVFRMPVAEVFNVKSMGIIATGEVSQGTLKNGDEVEIIGCGKRVKAQVGGLEMFRKFVDYVTVGDNPGVILKDIEPNQIKPGMMLTTPNSTQMTDHFKAIVYVQSQNDCGEPRAALATSRPSFCINSAKYMSMVTIVNGEYCMPGHCAVIDVQLVDEIPYISGARFKLHNKRLDGTELVAEGTIL